MESGDLAHVHQRRGGDEWRRSEREGDRTDEGSGDDAWEGVVIVGVEVRPMKQKIMRCLRT